MEQWLERSQILIGPEQIEKLTGAHVAIIGLGGVGGYVAEALARSGIGYLTLADGDEYSLSNLNRQIGALSNTLGRLKAEVMGERIMLINPRCHLQIIGEKYVSGDFAAYLPQQYTFIADAIDDIPAKVDLLAECYQRQIPVISAMGTGNKLDPTKLRIADISKTQICPLARNVRRSLRQKGVTKGIRVVYSQELPCEVQTSFFVGSMIFVPAAAGLLMANYIVRSIITGESK